jgi:hypothetical protein
MCAHQQLRTGKQRIQPMGVFRQFSIYGLGKTKIPFDDQERVLHFATNGYKAISSKVDYIGKYININIIENERFCVLCQYINQFQRINLVDTLLGVYHFLAMRMASIISSHGTVRDKLEKGSGKLVSTCQS